MGTVVNGERRRFGPISNDTAGLATTLGQIGGEGVCRWKMLMNGMHLEGHWNCVEYVVIEPGASIGEHVHVRTEEIYYIISGHALMKINGESIPCSAGDLITAPIGTAHGIENQSQEEVRFFVVEVFPGEGRGLKPALIHLPGLASDSGSTDVDLKPYFSGDWRRFRLLEIAAQSHDDAITTNSEVVHVLNGSASIHVADQWHYQGSGGLSLALPPGTQRRISNAAGNEPLRLIITEVAAA